VRLPAELRTELSHVIGEVSGVEPVAGGCVSSTARLRAAAGSYFLKFRPGSPDQFFEVEAEGLGALAGAATGLRIPEVFGCGETPGTRISWILMEWLEPTTREADCGDVLGRGVARLHACIGEGWGWGRSGYIGPLRQANDFTERWATFWAGQRLQPQLELARRGGYIREDENWERLLDMLPRLLAPAEEEGPRLLHGDLWAGNVIAVEGSAPALVDPSCYYGHREVDLAMTALFGGFSGRFYDSYAESLPLSPGHEARRRVYQLYYLLVHVNLFGASYLRRTSETLRQVLAEG